MKCMIVYIYRYDRYDYYTIVCSNWFQKFIDDVGERSKKACPHIGEWLMLLAASFKYT